MSSVDVAPNVEDPDIKAAVLKKLAAETSHERARARRERASARYSEIVTAAEIRNERYRLTNDRFHRVYRFNDHVDEHSVQTCMDTLYFWNRTEPGCEFEIIFNSPGGSVFAGMELFDFIQELRREGHYVTTSARGMAASMAGILLQAGDRRVMGAEARVLIHQVSSIAMGKVYEIEDEVALMKAMGDRVLDIFAKRAVEAGANGTAAHPITKAQLRRGWERKDWWLDSDECLDKGIVDEVR